MIRWFDSSAIKGIDYDIQRRALEVFFVSGADYVYAGVPPRIVNDFAAAESKGRFFHDHILDRFAFERRR